MARLRFVTAREVFDAFPTAKDDIEEPPTEEPPFVFLDKLVAGDSPEEAVAFCAYLLGRREAVWWACQSVRNIGPPVSREDETALLVAEAWVREPEEHRRRAALNIGLNGDHDLAGVWTSLAAGGSGGTMISGDQPGPTVPPHLTAKAARAAVLVALANLEEVRERTDQIKACAALCRRLAQDDGNPS
jgi:hypothetical protein